MGISDFRARMLRGDLLAGTFVKTPDVQVIEVLAASGLDFLCLDADHTPAQSATSPFPGPAPTLPCGQWTKFCA